MNPTAGDSSILINIDKRIATNQHLHVQHSTRATPQLHPHRHNHRVTFTQQTRGDNVSNMVPIVKQNKTQQQHRNASIPSTPITNNETDNTINQQRPHPHHSPPTVSALATTTNLLRQGQL